MFTGLIEEVGKLISFQHKQNDATMNLACSTLQETLCIGDSVSCNGICLTVTSFNASQIHVDLSLETKQLSLFPTMKQDAEINLERALTLQKPLGGHLLQGHVDGQSLLQQVEQVSTCYVLTFSLPSNELVKYMVYKGSIGINGISLTLSSLTKNNFSVTVIPHTYKHTNLKNLSIGTAVHIETDILAKYVENALFYNQKTKNESNITDSFLQKHGFLF